MDKIRSVARAQLPDANSVKGLSENQRKECLADNRSAVDAYNSRVERQGLFSERLHLF